MLKKEGTEFLNALNILAEEKHISKDGLFSAMEMALTTAYKKNYNLTNVRVDMDKTTGVIKVFSVYTVVSDEDDDYDMDTEIPLSLAREKVKKIEIGETIEEEVTPKDFGRVAAATAKQVIVQRVKEAEKESLEAELADKEGELIVGTLSMEDEKNYLVDIGRTMAILPKKELIGNEKLVMGNSVKAYVSKINIKAKSISILLTRRHYGFVKRLFESEIPEIAEGNVLIHGIAREAGVRSKVSLSSINPNIDPIGTCVGEKGARITNIVKELNNEKVDLVKYDEDPRIFIANALQPAKDVNVIILDEESKEKHAMAIVDEKNLSLAIGKKGINVVLASKLTHFRIDVKTKKQLESEGINIK